jgi:N-acetylmuramoyl-L-alanine amidase
MRAIDPITRRLLLGRLASGSGVVGTFLLPPGLHQAMAAAISGGGHVQPRRPAASRGAHLAPLVMLDPGHGGKDPGAIGMSGTYEKHIALDAALELHRLLQTDGRYRVVLTRWRDVFIPLEQRVDFAQEHGASLFVSMHADALTDHDVRGASVYTLSNRASDAQTAALAQRENSADRFATPKWHVSPEVARILASLVRRETTVGSVSFARDVVNSLDREVRMLPNPDRHAGFVVLKSASIPSVLVEMGFMSNPRDEAELRQAAHRRLVAVAMKRAVDAFFTARSHIAHAQRDWMAG